MGVLVDEQATISNSVQTASSPAHQERTVNGRWGTGVWGMEWAEYTGNTPRRKDQGWAKWLPNKRPSRSGEGRVNLAEAVVFEQQMARIIRVFLFQAGVAGLGFSVDRALDDRWVNVVDHS